MGKVFGFPIILCNFACNIAADEPSVLSRDKLKQ